MDLTSFHFRPQPLPTLLLGAALIVLTALGFWQLDRAAQKRSLGARLQLMGALPALTVDGSPLEAAEVSYRKVAAQGHWVADKSVLIENRRNGTRIGFHVITPLRIAGSSRHLLVNRGWIEAGPGLTQPPIDTPTDWLTITGEARVTEPPALELEFDLNSGDPLRHWPYLTVELYGRWSGLDVYPFIVLEADRDPGELVRSWEPPSLNPEMHLGYAVQWFAFALITLVIWIRLSLAGEDRSNG